MHSDSVYQIGYKVMRQIQFHDQFDSMWIQVISSDNQQYLRIQHDLPNGEYIVSRASKNYQTVQMLSEALRDAIGYGPARDLLLKNGVAEDDPLMTLGRKGDVAL